MTIEYRREGQIAIYTLDNPSRMNALDSADLNALFELLTLFNKDPDLRVGIIIGKGEKAFCSGFDINIFSSGKTPAQPSSPQSNPMLGLEITKPLIAAVNGAAVGGGLELALFCDLRIASDTAVFGFPEVKLGLIPTWGGTQRLPRQISWCQAAEMLLTGENIDAQTALRFGLINRVVPQEQVFSSALAMAETIGRAAPLAVQAAKEAMLKGQQVTHEEGLQIEDALAAYLKTTSDFREGVDAFLTKRPPHFTGN